MAKSAVGELLSIALPTVAQMASYTVMQFIDTLMLSRLGDLPATAGANSGMLTFAIIGAGMGIVVLVNTLVSQEFGRKKDAECGRYIWQGIWVGVIFGLLAMPMGLAAGKIFSGFGHPADLAGMEAGYCRVVLLGTAIKLAGVAIGQGLMGVDHAGWVLVSAVVGTAVNALAAWLMIFGHGGFHSMGVLGSAWAQNVGTLAETGTLLFFILRPAMRLRFGTLDFRLRLAYLAKLVKLGAPSGVQWMGDMLAWAFFCNKVLGLIGPEAMAANTFMMRYMVVSFMPAVGFGVATTALVGRYIGAGRPDIAARRAHMAFGITSIYVVICGTIFVLGRGPMIHLFTRDPQVWQIGKMYMIFCAVYGLTDAVYIIYNGALRGAGDTFVPAVVMLTFCWGISIGGGWYVAKYHKHDLGAAGPWMVGLLYGIVLGSFMLIRFLAGGWKKINLSGNLAASNAPSNVPDASATLETRVPT